MKNKKYNTAGLISKSNQKKTLEKEAKLIPRTHTYGNFKYLTIPKTIESQRSWDDMSPRMMILYIGMDIPNALLVEGKVFMVAESGWTVYKKMNVFGFLHISD